MTRRVITKQIGLPQKDQSSIKAKYKSKLCQGLFVTAHEHEVVLKGNEIITFQDKYITQYMYMYIYIYIYLQIQFSPVLDHSYKECPQCSREYKDNSV